MADPKRFDLILKRMVESKMSGTGAGFPDSGELYSKSLECRPDREESFQEALTVYRYLEQGGMDSKLLIHGAVCFYVSYEVPPDWARMAIVNLLWSGGDYTSACLYALECFPMEQVQNLLCGNLAFRINKYELNICYLALPYWPPELILALLVQHLRHYRPSERGGIIEAVIYKINRPENLPKPLLEAVCISLYQSLLGFDATQHQKLEQFILEHSYLEIAEEFLSQYCHTVERIDFTVREYEDNAEWLKRQKEFNRLYADREKRGYFLYNPASKRKGAVLLHAGLVTAYKLNPDYTAAQADILNADRTRDITLSVKYKGYSESLQISESKPLKYREIEQLEIRIQMLKKLYQDDADLMNAYDALKDNCVITRLFEDMLNFQDRFENMKSGLKLFHRYAGYKWHDQELAKNAVSFLVQNYTDELSEKNYMSLFNYYLRIDDYDAAKNFSIKYKDRLGKQYGKKANTQLMGFLEKAYHKRNLDSSNTYIAWKPYPLKKGYGGFAEYFLTNGWNMLQQEKGDFSSSDSMQLYDEAERFRQKALNNANQKNIAAEFYLMAGTALNRRREQFGDSDTDEMMTDYLIHAFFYYSYQEAEKLDMNDDVRRTYLEQALRLSRQLNPGYIDSQLGGMLEDMQKRYFKAREGHDNDYLKEAVIYMSQKQTVSDAEFGSSMLRISIYYPDFLLNPQIVDLCMNDEEVKRRLVVFLQSSGYRYGTSNGILDWIRSYRNKLVEEFNAIDFQIDKVEREVNEKQEFEKTAVRIHQLCGKKELYRVLSVTDKMYVDCLDALFAKLPDENTDFQELCGFRKQCMKLKADMEAYPCSFAIEHLYGCISALAEYVQRLYCSMYDEVQPQLRLKALFAEDVQKEPDFIRVYLLVENRKGKSAVLDIEAVVQESEWVLETGCQSICSYVGQAGQEYGFVSMRLKASVSKKEKLNFCMKLKYIVEMMHEEMSQIVELETDLNNRRLYEDYEQMYNHGSALDDGQGMAEYTFYGRDEIIQRICQIFYDFPKSIVVLYGQRRVGKTSIANHIAAKVQKSGRKFLVVKCGNSNLTVLHNNKADFTEDVIQEFYTIVMKKLVYAIEKTGRRTEYLDKEIKEIKNMILGTRKSDEPAVSPMLFRKLVMQIQQLFEHEEEWKGTRILLWFDEFQQYYLKILEGRIQPEAVGFIKAFTEEFGFSLLLVGCEPMIPFIEEGRFGNMFSASTQEYVEYLTEESAKGLICEPLYKKCKRENPFKYVKDEIYRFSAGSPFFIQLICEYLIVELNRQKKVYADKHMIIEMLHEKQKVKHAYFNCLYDSLNSSEQAASPEDNKKVLIRIALCQGSRAGSRRCDIVQDLEGKTQKDASKVIDELISRKVVEEVQDELRIVVRLYEAWIWENRFELGYEE